MFNILKNNDVIGSKTYISWILFIMEVCEYYFRNSDFRIEHTCIISPGANIYLKFPPSLWRHDYFQEPGRGPQVISWCPVNFFNVVASLLTSLTEKKFAHITSIFICQQRPVSHLKAENAISLDFCCLSYRTL